MTIQELKDYRFIKAEIKRNGNRIEELSGYNETDIESLRDKLQDFQKWLIEKETEITQWINHIDDAQVRISIQMHYIDGKSWNEVADEIGGGNTDVSCRKYVSRYLQNHLNLSDMSQTDLL